VQVTANGETYSLPQQALSVAGSEWSLLPADIFDIVVRLYRDHPPLCETLRRRPVMGVKSGDNGAFFLDVARVHGDWVETSDGLQIPLRFAARCVRGRDITQRKINGASWMFWPPRGGWDRIPRWLERFAKARHVDPDALQLAYVRPEHLGIKVVWKDVSRGICAAVLRDHEVIAGRRVPLVPNQTLYALESSSLEEAESIVALLNSTIVNALAVITDERAKDFHYRYFGRTIGRIPLPLNALTTSPREAYGLTPAEEERLGQFVARRLGRAADD